MHVNNIYFGRFRDNGTFKLREITPMYANTCTGNPKYSPIYLINSNPKPPTSAGLG